MIKIEDRCVMCPQGCVSCGASHTPVRCCDVCGEEMDEWYDIDGDELCKDCLDKRYKVTIWS